MQDDAIARVIAELERLADDARDRWALPKRVTDGRIYSWQGREIGYREALRLLVDAGVADVGSGDGSPLA